MRVLPDLNRGAPPGSLGHDPPCLEHIAIIGKRKGCPSILLHEQDGPTFLVDLRKCSVEFCDQDRSQA